MDFGEPLVIAFLGTTWSTDDLVVNYSGESRKSLSSVFIIGVIVVKEIRTLLKKTPVYPRYIRLMARRVTDGSTRLNILKTFPTFEAHGWGLYPARAALTIQSINQVVPGLRKLALIPDRHENFKNELTRTFPTSSAAQGLLSSLFNHYGSDKSSIHNYHETYCQILKNH